MFAHLIHRPQRVFHSVLVAAIVVVVVSVIVVVVGPLNTRLVLLFSTIAVHASYINDRTHFKQPLPSLSLCVHLPLCQAGDQAISLRFIMFYLPIAVSACPHVRPREKNKGVFAVFRFIFRFIV